MIRTLKRQGTSPRTSISKARSSRPAYSKPLRVERLESRWMFSVASGPDAQRLILSEPTGHAVFQRDSRDWADLAVTGIVDVESATRVEARAVAMDGFNGTDTDWALVDDTLLDGNFTGSLTVSAGWYAIEVRAWDATSLVAQTTVEQVGVGEVFVAAGQSNSANFGTSRLTPQDERISAYGPDGWQTAADPQPMADGNGGSPWPALGDMLVQRFDVPIGFISVGVGGTRVDEWLPDGPYYSRLEDALESLGPRGLRAVLWHQGEYDNYTGTSTDDYASRLSRLIEQSRIDAGWNVPWGVALAGFLPYGTPEGQAAVVAAQQQVIEADPWTFEGASTDDLIDPTLRRPDAHFTEAGLRAHAARWMEPISTLITESPTHAIDPRLDELLEISPDGTDVIVRGTEGNDAFAVSIGSPHRLVVNGIVLESDRMTRLTVVGGGGSDTFEMTGAAGDESAMLRPFAATIVGTGYEVEVSDIGSITLYGGGGNDSAVFEDSPGDDEFVAAPGFGRLDGDGFSLTVRDVDSVLAKATAGGRDVAKLFDSPGNDNLVTTPVYACLYGDGFRLQVEQFEGAHAYAGAGGIDVAKLFDSPGDDTFYADPTVAALYGDGYFHRAKYFEGVHAYATSGGFDTAKLFDSAGDDTFFSIPTSSALFGNGFYNRAKFFEQVQAHGGAGGTDRAYLFDSATDDLLTAEDDWARLVNDLATVWLEGFEQVEAEANNGGRNRAQRTAIDYLLRLTGEWS